MLTGVTAYLYLQVCAADGAVQLLLSELLSAAQTLQLVVSQGHSQLTNDLTLIDRKHNDS